MPHNLRPEHSHLESLAAAPSLSPDTSTRLEQGLAADQAARERRRVRWEDRRARLIRSIEASRRCVFHLMGFGGALIVLVLVLLVTGPGLNLDGLVALGLMAGCTLAGLLFRTLISAVGEAMGRGLVRAARQEGVDLVEVRFD